MRFVFSSEMLDGCNEFHAEDSVPNTILRVEFIAPVENACAILRSFGKRMRPYGKMWALEFLKTELPAECAR